MRNMQNCTLTTKICHEELRKRAMTTVLVPFDSRHKSDLFPLSNGRIRRYLNTPKILKSNQKTP